MSFRFLITCVGMFWQKRMLPNVFLHLSAERICLQSENTALPYIISYKLTLNALVLLIVYVGV